jgi:hypothetical protein
MREAKIGGAGREKGGMGAHRWMRASDQDRERAAAHSPPDG